MNEYKDYLNVTVIQENKPVTYKTLARSLGIHVNAAKQALYEFSKENQQTVHAVYCMTGRNLKNDQFNIQLVKASELEETKQLFRQITGIHVYSVTSFEPLDFSILYTTCKDAIKLSLEDRGKCGILKNNNVTAKKSTSKPVDTRAPEVSKPFAKGTPSPVKASPAPARATASKPTGPVKRKGTLMFGPTATKKQAVAEQSKNTPKPSCTFDSKISAEKKKSDADDIEMRLAKTTIRPEDIFSDEEEQEEEPKPEEPDMIDMDDNDDFMEVEVAKTEATPPPPEPTPPTLPGQTKRKVLRKKTTKNARGFLVTEEVWEWEVVDESEAPPSAAPVQPKPAAAPKKTAKKGGQAQTDLFSFFKKK